MSPKTLIIKLVVIALVTSGSARANEISDGYWSQQQAAQILEKTRHVFLDPDLSVLTDGERAAVAKLLDAGQLIQILYEDSMHPQALAATQFLLKIKGNGLERQYLQDLFYLFEGPIASTLDNRRLPFLPVIAEQPGKNVYPVDMTRQKMDPILQAQPGIAD